MLGPPPLRQRGNLPNRPRQGAMATQPPLQAADRQLAGQPAAPAEARRWACDGCAGCRSWRFVPNQAGTGSVVLAGRGRLGQRGGLPLRIGAAPDAVIVEAMRALM